MSLYDVQISAKSCTEYIYIYPCEYSCYIHLSSFNCRSVLWCPNNDAEVSPVRVYRRVNCGFCSFEYFRNLVPSNIFRTNTENSEANREQIVYLCHHTHHVNATILSRKIAAAWRTLYLATLLLRNHVRPGFRLSNLFVCPYFTYFFRHISFQWEWSVS